jgi:hypothetical protein
MGHDETYDQNHAIEISKRAADDFCKIGNEMEYWKQRCLLAEKVLHCPPMGHHQLLQWHADKQAYNKFIEENKEP